MYDLRFWRRGSRSGIDDRETDRHHCNGFAPFPSTLVISTERSGLDLLRHAVESVTELRTPGKTRYKTKGPLAFHRTHWVNSPRITRARTVLHGADGRPLYEKVMLPLRDPREILPRAYGCDLTRMGE